MPINAIRSADIFEDRLNPGEERNGVQIVFGINTQGTNQDVNSVASQVAKKYDETFWKIPRNDLTIGQVYSGQGYIHPALPARFHGIVCNEKELHTGKHDWTFADLGVHTGLETLENGIVVPKYTVSSTMTSFKQEVAELLAQGAPYDTIKKVFEDTEAVLHPPVRTAFIGTGPSGTKNHADWRGILEAMNNSSLNIILYIYDQQIKAEVAKVVKLFPTLREVRSLQDIEEQYGVAA